MGRKILYNLVLKIHNKEKQIKTKSIMKTITGNRFEIKENIEQFLEKMNFLQEDIEEILS